MTVSDERLQIDSTALSPTALWGTFVIATKVGDCYLHGNAEELLHPFRICHRIRLF